MLGASRGIADPAGERSSIGAIALYGCPIRRTSERSPVAGKSLPRWDGSAIARRPVAMIPRFVAACIFWHKIVGLGWVRLFNEVRFA